MIWLGTTFGLERHLARNDIWLGMTLGLERHSSQNDVGVNTMTWVSVSTLLIWLLYRFDEGANMIRCGATAATEDLHGHFG